MKNLFNGAMDVLNKELERRGITHDVTDDYRDYGAFEVLEGVYDWGFTTIMYCDVLEPIISFYDWEYQKILSLDCDSCTTYHLCSGRLSVRIKHTFSDYKEEFSIYLKNGAPVHVEDIKAIGYTTQGLYRADDFYALKDGRIYAQKDGEHLKLCEAGVTVEDFITQGYQLVPVDSYPSNVDSLNEMLSRNIMLTYRP